MQQRSHDPTGIISTIIPLALAPGFLSYREAVELDFTRFSLACISGPNGAGKSGLLGDRWVSFGRHEKRL